MPKSPLPRKNKKSRSLRENDFLDSPPPNSAISPTAQSFFHPETDDENFCMDCRQNGVNKLEDLLSEICPFCPEDPCDILCKHTKFFKNVLGGDGWSSISQLKADPTFVIEAIHNNQTPILHLLIEYGFTTSGQSLVSGSTALIAAVSGQFYDIVEILLSSGADPSECGSHNCTPLMYAANDNSTRMARLLLHYGASTSVPPKHETPPKPSKCACKCGHPHTRHTTEEPFIAAPVYENPVITSIRGHNLELLQLLLKDTLCGVHSVTTGYSPLIESIKHRFDPILDLLLENSAVLEGLDEVCGEGSKTALSMAAKYNHSDIAERLIELGADTESGGRTPLMEASRMGHAETVSVLLDNGANPWAQTDSFQTTVLFAAETDSVEVMSSLHEALCSQQGSITTCQYYLQSDYRGMTPLLKSCSKGNCKVAYYLLENCVSVKCVNAGMPETGHTAFTLACNAGCVDLVSYLYQGGADPLHHLNDGSTALNEAAKSNNARLIPLLYQFIHEFQIQGQNYEPVNSSPPSISDDGEESTPYNLRKSRKGVSERLFAMNHYVNPLPDGQFPVDFQPEMSVETINDEHFYSKCPDITDCVSLDSTFANFTEEMDLLGNSSDLYQLPSSFLRHCNHSCGNLYCNEPVQHPTDHKTDIFSSFLKQHDKKGYTPFMTAAASNSLEIVKELVFYGANLEDTTDRKDTALGIASAAGNTDILVFLVEAGANLNHRNSSDYTPLTIAASGGHLETMSAIIAAGADINSRDDPKYGITPCMLAALSGHYEAVELLIKLKCDVNCYIETNRNSALTLACYQGKPDIVELLLLNGAQIEHRAKNGCSPLMEAATIGLDSVGSTLIRLGADVNAPPVPQTKETALTIAAERGKTSFVELLLKNNVQIESKNKKGCTALWLATNAGHLDVVKLLVAGLADVHTCCSRGYSCLETAFRRGHVDIVKFLVQKVKQFPSNGSCQRTMSSITDKDILERCRICFDILMEFKQTQVLEADRNADLLLQQIEDEKQVSERKKQATIRRREVKKRKKMDKQQTEDCAFDEPKSVCPENDIIETRSPVSELTDSQHQSPIEDEKGEESEEVSSTPVTSYNYQLPKITDFYSSVVSSEKETIPIPNGISKPSKDGDHLPVVRPKKPGPKKLTSFVYGEELTQEVSKNSRVIRVPACLFGRIMGRGGAHMNKIREISLANIEVEQQKPGMEHRRIKIRGTVKSMTLAQHIISHIVTEQQQDVLEILSLYENEEKTLNLSDQACDPRSDVSEETRPSVALSGDSGLPCVLNFMTNECYHGPIEPNDCSNTIILKNSYAPVFPMLQTAGVSNYSGTRKVHKQNGYEVPYLQPHRNSPQVAPESQFQFGYPSGHDSTMNHSNSGQFNGGQYINNCGAQFNGGQYLMPEYMMYSQPEYYNNPYMAALNSDMYDVMGHSGEYGGAPNNEYSQYINGHHGEVDPWKNGIYPHVSGRNVYDSSASYGNYETDSSHLPTEWNSQWRNVERKKH